MKNNATILKSKIMQINFENKRALSFRSVLVCDIRDYKLFALKFVGLENF